MTIEKLEALERAATAGPWRQGDGGMVYGPDTFLVCNCFGWTSNHSTDAGNARFVVAARDSIGPLLAVAKAAKAYVDQWPNASTAHANLVFAVAQLEATP